jgi:hypothetical protein
MATFGSAYAGNQCKRSSLGVGAYIVVHWLLLVAIAFGGYF